MAKQRQFYNSGTEAKLEALKRYMQSYLQVMSKQDFETVYIDAFAGSGDLPTSNHLPTPEVDPLFEDQLDSDNFVRGSAMRALELEKPFSKYIFIDKRKVVLEELKAKTEKIAHLKQRIEFAAGDAAYLLKERCAYLSNKRVRALVFLDPFGNQVSWELLKSLADTKHVDLWYLFPAMLGVYRQIGNHGAVMTVEQENSLDKLFGPNDWRKAFIGTEVEMGLFGSVEVQKKIANVVDITRFKIDCLKTIFAGGVSDRWLPLGRNGAHWYSLIFAMANPSPKAVRAGHNIANHIMTRSISGRLV